MSDEPKHVHEPSDKQVRAANREGRMGPGEHAGGYASQRFDTDRHGGTYGSNESSGASYPEQDSQRLNADLSGCNGVRDPLADRGVLHGQQHMSGRYGTQAFGRLDGPPPGIPVDPTQRSAIPAGEVAVDSRGGARPPDASHNAMISASGAPAPISRGSENERNAPGISTDKSSDDTKV